MRLIVQAPAKRPSPTNSSPTLILVSDYWNDYGYRTMFDLWVESESSELENIGSVRILKKGQIPGEAVIKPGEVVAGSLSHEFCSLGMDLDYYASISILDSNLRDNILRNLNDITAAPEITNHFQHDEGYTKSLHRDRSQREREEFIADANRTLKSGGKLPEIRDFAFTYKDSKSGIELEFNFSNPISSRTSMAFDIPYRFNVIVGPNGTGKTALLSKLARLAYAAPRERIQLSGDGEIVENVGFPNIVAISYSAFDNFEPPNLSGDDADLFADKLRSGDGRYIYCGLRDIARSFMGDGPESTRIITRDELAESFSVRYQSVYDLKRADILASAMMPILMEGSLLRSKGITDIDGRWSSNSDQLFAVRSAKNAIDKLFGDEPAKALLSMSSGHQIVLHIIVSLLATIRRRGIALIDEPETHLHPPLLAALMGGIRKSIDQLQAYCVIATHSPVIVQETLTSKIRVLSKVGESVIARQPKIETFGENVGVLTREIFGLYPNQLDFRGLLDQMLSVYKTAEKIEEILGTSLSSQARAYVMMNAQPLSEDK